MIRFISGVTNAVLVFAAIGTGLVLVYTPDRAVANTSFELPQRVEVSSTTAAINTPTHPITTPLSQDQLECLQQNVYFEAGTESVAGKIAVALVTLNRVTDTRYPNTICEVVKQGPVKESWKTAQYPDLPEQDRVYTPIRNRCQFSWHCDGKPDVPYEGIGWQQSKEVAYRVAVMGMYRGMIEGATHYHATYVSPHWRNAFTLVGKIDEHIFYRWEQ